jgi:alkanesulfonate monooxygenase SsuD/methylene tetrahydromethanopterin reductase-like flavin-dependent oxidoreductase (luciferase family)
MTVEDLRAVPGRVGLWSMELRSAGQAEARDAASELDGPGFWAQWIPGGDGTRVFGDLGRLLQAAPHTAVALGVLGIWGYDPAEAGEHLHALDRAYGPRAILGFGVSSAASAAAAGREYGDPVTSVAAYLDRLDAAVHPVPFARRVLGALGPKMAALGARRAAGPVIAPHQAVVLDTDPARARTAARDGIGMVIGFPAYQNNLRRPGFTDDDLVPGGSDRLIDAAVAWGTVDDIRRRVQAHLDAGAGHVALHVLGGRGDLPLPQWRQLAELLPSTAGGRAQRIRGNP